MKQFEEKQVCLQEMSLQEMTEINGGWIISSILFALAWDYANDPDGCRAAMANGWNDARK